MENGLGKVERSIDAQSVKVNPFRFDKRGIAIKALSLEYEFSTKMRILKEVII